MNELVGFNFENQRMTPDAYGRTLENTFSDGILSGCAMAYSGTTFTVKAGYLVVGGREIQFATDALFAIDQATSGYARIIITIDLSKTATLTTFEQVSTSVEYSSTLNGFRSLTKEDINGIGAVYECVLATVSLGTGGVTGISSQLSKVAVSIPEKSLSGNVLKPGAIYRGSINLSLAKDDWTLNAYGSYEQTKVFSGYGYTPDAHVGFLGHTRGLTHYPGDGNSNWGWSLTLLKEDEKKMSCLYSARLIAEDTVKFVATKIPNGTLYTTVLFFRR